jgi:hypothetical protein
MALFEEIFFETSGSQGELIVELPGRDLMEDILPLCPSTGLPLGTGLARDFVLPGFRLATSSSIGSCPAKRAFCKKQNSMTERIGKRTIPERFMIQLSNIG